MMVCTALMVQQVQPMYYPLLDDPLSPSVRNLQRWIEAAWKAGFDEEGAKDLKNLMGTKTWVGTSDLWVAFMFRGIPAELVDFKDIAIVTDWIVNYFSPSEQHSHSTITDALRGATVVTSTERMPIILQYKGHSQTIVGYEISKSGAVNLLAFDPSKLPSNKLRRAALASLVASKSQSPSKASSSSYIQGGSTSLTANNSAKRRQRAALNELKSKRSRSGDRRVDDDGVIIISDSEGHSSEPEQTYVKPTAGEDPPPADVLSFFRVIPRKIELKTQYQILYFPLHDPLDDVERLSKKVVVSHKVC